MARASKGNQEPSWRAAVTELVGVIWEHGDVAEMEVPLEHPPHPVPPPPVAPSLLPAGGCLRQETVCM